MKLFLTFLALIVVFSCKTDTKKNNTHLEYSTSENALKHYRKGWIRIMDEGHYGDAEVSYRRALELDSTFLVGKSVLARLTLDLNERIQLYQELQKKKGNIYGDERLVLDVYTALVYYTNLRDQGASETKIALQEALKIGEENLRKIIHKYPEEVYLKAEYFEILHSIYGPRQALDSLHMLSTISQKENPFLLGFAASMHAELGDYGLAMKKANRLLEVVNDSMLPKTYAVLADIYFKMGSLKIAKSNADRATKIDFRNLDASRLKKKIDEAIQLEKTPL